jgi:hypothetical protein
MRFGLHVACAATVQFALGVPSPFLEFRDFRVGHFWGETDQLGTVFLFFVLILETITRITIANPASSVA